MAGDSANVSAHLAPNWSDETAATPTGVGGGERSWRPLSGQLQEWCDLYQVKLRLRPRLAQCQPTHHRSPLLGKQSTRVPRWSID